MALLILGLALWVFGHLFKYIAPAARARLGDRNGKGIVALVIVAGLFLIVIGYRGAPMIHVWHPPSWTMHLNNLLMLVSVFVFGTAHTTGRLRGWTRHAMLTSVKIWALAHLLVNGDLASIILFGTVLGWAVLSVIVINKAKPDWDRPAKPETGGIQKDVVLVVITLVVFAVITGVHKALGVSPFPAGG